MKNKKIKPITKARNLETTKKVMVFYRTPFFFRVFVMSPWVLFYILVYCLLYSFFISLVSSFRHFRSL
jgi:hypothetical protein